MKKKIARAAFRAAWVQYATCTNAGRKMDLQMVMRVLQSHCAAERSAWEEFAATLPGYVAYWAQVSKIVEKASAERVRR